MTQQPPPESPKGPPPPITSYPPPPSYPPPLSPLQEQSPAPDAAVAAPPVRSDDPWAPTPEASGWSPVDLVRPLGASTAVSLAAAGLLTLLEVVQAIAAFPAGARYVAAARSGTDASSIYTRYDGTAIFVVATGLVCWVATCVWLGRARHNATTIHPGSHQARGAAWVWWGWIVPVVYLWFPYQVVKDVLVALRPAGSRTLLRLWWSSWLVYLVTDHATWFLLPASGVPDELAARAVGPVEAVNATACLVALVGWVLLVRTVRADQEKAATDAVRGWVAPMAAPAGSASPVDAAPASGPWGSYPEPEAGMSAASWPGRQGSRAMAVWALVLAVIPIPLTWLAGIALALTSLVQSRRGKGFAVAALVIAPLWIVLSIGTLAIVFLDQATSTTAGPQAGPDTPSSPRSPTDTQPERDPSPGHEVFVDELTVGDCLPKGYPNGRTETVRVAPCSQPHLEEVYVKFNLAPGPYPGDKRVDRRAGNGCFKRFEQFVGISFDSSELDMYYLTPVRDFWREDRSVVCTVAVTSPITGTLKGSRR